MTKVVNLTPHPVSLETVEGGIVEIPPSGIVLKAAERISELGYTHTENGAIRTVKVRYHRPEPDPYELPGWDDSEVLYVVSSITMRAIYDWHSYVAWRFCVPYDLVRDESGRVLRARALGVG